MKKTFFAAALLGMAFTSCNDATPGYTISGTVEGVSDDTYVYLSRFESDKPVVKVDSTKVSNGTFTFVGRQDTASVYFMLCGKKSSDTFFLQNGKINAKLHETDPEVTGTSDNDIYQSFKFKKYEIFNKLSQVVSLLNQKDLSPEVRDSLEQQYKVHGEALKSLVSVTIDENMTNLVGPYLLLGNSYNYDLSTLQTLVAKIPADLTGSPVQALKDYVQFVESTSVGQKFTDFTMNDPEGKEVKLSDFIKGNKYTLIDFWASWCGPCRREMPAVIEAYEAFHCKGFDIVGVSLDQNHAAWADAIERMGLKWHHMSDLEGWKCEGARLYNVRSIPATVLVDENGTIIARNLNGEEVKEKLKELLK